jgi:hypothetical protein
MLDQPWKEVRGFILCLIFVALALFNYDVYLGEIQGLIIVLVNVGAAVILHFLGRVTRS